MYLSGSVLSSFRPGIPALHDPSPAADIMLKRISRKGGQAMKLGSLSREELKALIKEAVEEALVELLGDPDEGLELRPEVRGCLQRSLERVRQGESGIPAEEVAKRAGLVG